MNNIPMVVDTSLNGVDMSVVINAIPMTLEIGVARFQCAKTLRVGATKNGCKYVHVSTSKVSRHYDLSPSPGFSISMHFASWAKKSKTKKDMSGIFVIAFDEYVYIAELTVGVIVNENLLVVDKAIEMINSHKNTAGKVFWVEGGKLHYEISGEFQESDRLVDFTFPPTASEKKELRYVNLNWYMFRNGYWDSYHFMALAMSAVVLFGVGYLYKNYKEKAVQIIVAQQKEARRVEAEKKASENKKVQAKKSSFSGAAQLREFQELLVRARNSALRTDGLYAVGLVEDTLVIDGNTEGKQGVLVSQYVDQNGSWIADYGNDGLWRLKVKSKVEVDIRELTEFFSNAFAPELIPRLARIARSPVSYKFVEGNLKSGIEVDILLKVKVGIVAVLGDIADFIEEQSFSVNRITCLYPETAQMECEIVLKFRHLLK